MARVNIIKKETTRLDQEQAEGRNVAKLSIRTLFETKKQSELRERRERLECRRAKKARKTQREAKSWTSVEGCLEDEYDLEGALLAIEGSPHDSKHKAREKKRGNSDHRKMGKGNNPVNDKGVIPCVIKSGTWEEEGRCVSSTADVNHVQKQLQELLFRGKLLKRVVFSPNENKKINEDYTLGIEETTLASPDQVRSDMQG